MIGYWNGEKSLLNFNSLSFTKICLHASYGHKWPASHFHKQKNLSYKQLFLTFSCNWLIGNHSGMQLQKMTAKLYYWRAEINTISFRFLKPRPQFESEICVNSTDLAKWTIKLKNCIFYCFFKGLVVFHPFLLRLQYVLN